MKRIILSIAALLLAFATTKTSAQAVDLSKYSRITDLSQLEDGESYFIVSDRAKYNYVAGGDGGEDGDKVQTKAMANYQSGFTATNWDKPANNQYFVYYGDLNPKSNGFVWIAKKVGDKWAFLNAELNKYLGNHNPGETDLRFADEAVGYTLTKLPTHDGSYGFSFTNDGYLADFPGNPYINVHQYDRRKSRGVLALAEWSDSNAADAEANGYPGRWCLYKTTVQDAAPTIAEKMGLLRINRATDLVEGEEYFIVSDRTAYAASTTDAPKAMSTLQGNYSVKWGDNYVYWGDLDTSKDGYVWTVEEMPGNRWAFKNKENGRYLGTKNTGESDVIFSDTPVAYSLSDLREGAGKFSFVSSEDSHSLHVQGYLLSTRPNNSLAKNGNGDDDYQGDVETNGYPGRWHIYVKNTTQVKSPTDLKDGTTYYIVSDRKKFAASESEALRALSTQQLSYKVKWGDKYVYWGEMDKNADGFKWTAEKVGDKWAFRNVENGKYVGNMNTGETDVIFSDTPVGYSLSDLKAGAGKFCIASDEDSHGFHAQGYARSDRADNSVAKNDAGNDDNATDAATNGYPGRWLIYEANKVDKGEEPVYDKFHFDTINVVSYNIQHCVGMDGVLNVQRTADVINSFSPDAVALQEIDQYYSDRSDYEDQVQLLAEATNMYGKFSTVDINCGNAVLTKEKPLSYKIVDIGDSRNMLVAELKDYVFASIHVGLNIAARNSALDAMRKEAALWEAKGKPFIIAGDFNDDGNATEMQGVWGLLCDSLVKTFTFHSDRTTPTYHGDEGYVIDHIISYDKIGGVKTLDYKVVQSDASDHYPIAATLRVGFPKLLTPEEVRALIQDSISNSHTAVDMRDMAFNSDVTAEDLKTEGNVLVIVPEGSAITGTNIINNGVCANLVLTDGSNFAIPCDFVATAASYERTMANEWGTVCLPYDAQSNSEVEFYQIGAVEDGTLVVDKIATLAAGTPALVRKAGGDKISVLASDVAVTATLNNGTGSAVKMFGSYQNDLAVTNDNAYYIKANKFWQCNERFYCDAFRAYFTVGDAPSPSYSIVVNDDLTAISAREQIIENREQVYDLYGRKVLAPQKGINIVINENGQASKIIF